MEKKMIILKVYVHWIKADIMTAITENKVDLDKDSFREIAVKIGMAKVSAQQVKHHLEGLVTMGTLEKIGGKYSYSLLT